MIDNDDFDKRLDSGLKKMARHPVPSKEFCSAVMEKIRGKHLRWHQRLRQFMFRSHTFEWNFASSFASLFLLVMVFFGYESTNVQNNLPTSGASNLVNVRFMYESDMAKQIALSGNFNQWQPTYSLQQNAAGLCLSMYL